MPARRERIYLCPHTHGQPGWIMDFPAWWSRSGFFETYGSFDTPGSRWFDTGNPVFVKRKQGQLTIEKRAILVLDPAL